MDPTVGLATDGRSLDRLKLEASRDPVRAARAAASQFEALFMQSLLKSMRDAIQRTGLTDGPSGETYTAMLDQQFAQKLSGRPGGLSEVIARQLSRNIGPADATAKSTATTTAATTTATTAATTTAATTATGDAAARQGATAAAWRVRAEAMAGQPLSPRAPGAAIRAIDLVRADPQGASPGVKAAAAAALGGDLANDAAAESQARFVRAMWPHAVAVQRETGTPAHLVVGQAALESGWGRHEITRADGTTTHNLFGIKAGQSWKGKTVDAMTTEFVDGRPLRMIQKFRAYDSYAEAFTDWSRLMARNSRYDGVAKAGHDPAAYSQSMQKAGYATDPAYADKLEKSIRRTLALRRLVI